MSLRKLPAPSAYVSPQFYEGDPPAGAATRWLDAPMAAEADDKNTITIFGVIGEDLFGEGFTDKRMAAALRHIGPRDVTISVNSPGGDMFAGMAIYNLLREHPGKVTVKVMGIAASAASLIAMAADELLMGSGSELMLHRCWGLVIGNTHEMKEAAALFAKFDEDMASIYSAKSGMEKDEVLSILDGEGRGDGTWLSADEAIDSGFADGHMHDDAKQVSAKVKDRLSAVRKADLSLAKSGMPRSERRALLAEVKGGTHDAAPTVTHDADEIAALASGLFKL